MDPRQPVYKHIPNLLTLLNLCSGFLSIVFIFYRNLEAAALFIVIASLFDFLDGLAARLLNATSEAGKVLDSIADIVSFGVAPAALIFMIIEFSLVHSNPDFSFSTATFTDRLLLFTSVVLLITSALRLAVFTSRKDSTIFNGLPTPANALFVAGLTLILTDPGTEQITEWIIKLYLLIPVILLLSFLMISNIRFISFKFRQFGFQQNKLRYIFIAFSVVLLILLQKFGIVIIIISYIIVSVLTHFLSKSSDV
jgi:CDP-diacylglycerol--serine O-phosphatidyltransferase